MTKRQTLHDFFSLLWQSIMSVIDIAFVWIIFTSPLAVADLFGWISDKTFNMILWIPIGVVVAIWFVISWLCFSLTLISLVGNYNKDGDK